MTATTVDVVCPDWCLRDPQAHADDLWECGGEVHHIPADIEIELHSSVKATFAVGLVKATRPGGRECRPPVFFLDGQEASLEDMKAVRSAIDRMLALYDGERMLG